MSEYIPLDENLISGLRRKADSIDAQIEIVRDVHVCPLVQEWSEVVKKACPETPASSKIWSTEVVEHYRTIPIVEGRKDIVLLNFPKGNRGWDTVAAWGKYAELQPTHPYDIFSVSEQYPHLDSLLEKRLAAVAATSICEHKGNSCAPFVVWFQQGTVADLRLLNRLNKTDIWFSFTRTMSK